VSIDRLIPADRRAALTASQERAFEEWRDIVLAGGELPTPSDIEELKAQVRAADKGRRAVEMGRGELEEWAEDADFALTEVRLWLQDLTLTDKRLDSAREWYVRSIKDVEEARP
jgi:hypothetical protein